MGSIFREYGIDATEAEIQSLTDKANSFLEEGGKIFVGVHRFTHPRKLFKKAYTVISYNITIVRGTNKKVMTKYNISSEACKHFLIGFITRCEMDKDIEHKGKYNNLKNKLK